MASTTFKHLLNENVFDFVERTRKLLSVEKEDDIARLEDAYSHYTLKQLEEKGLCLRRIQITDIHTGLYGRSIVQFALHHNTDDSTSIHHKFTVGDIVKFVENDKITGVICKSFRNQLKIAIDDGISFEIGKDLTISHKYSLLLLIDTITYKKYNQTLSILCKPNIGIGTNIRNVLFTPSSTESKAETPSNSDDSYKPSITFEALNTNLNSSQLNAIQCALNAHDIFLIHGPPGTGKTTTIIELIYQSLIHHKRCVSTKRFQILACAPSNIAVDNMVEKLSDALYDKLINIVRIGHPARILESVLNKCLSSLLRGNGFKHDGKQLVNDIRKEIKENVQLLAKIRDKKERYMMYDEIKKLKKELRKYEEAMVNGVLNNADVILCTLCGASRSELKQREFDLCIIDEAAQSVEVACWIPMIKCKKVVLCGDHLQLPPTVKSNNAKELSYTLFDKLQTKFKHIYPPKIALLDTQYRMNDKICRFFSESLYDGKVKSHESVENHVLCGLGYLEKSSSYHDSSSVEKESRCLETALMMVDCAGIDGFEEDNVEQHVSKSNVSEAHIVSKHVEVLLNAGVLAEDIAVITPYRGQLKLLREIIHNELIEIGTVDGFQGREKEAIIVSFVRSNDEHNIGFLSDDRRTNVACTRARRHCCLFLNSQTLERHTFLHDLTDYCYAHADVRSADEYLVDDWKVIDQYIEMEQISIKCEKASNSNIKKNKIINNENKPKKGMNRAQKKKWRKKQKIDKNPKKSENDNIEQEEESSSSSEIDHNETQKDVISLLNALDDHVTAAEGPRNALDKKGKQKKKNIKYKPRNKVKKEKKRKTKDITHRMNINRVDRNNKKKKQKVNECQKQEVVHASKQDHRDLSDVLVNVNAKRCYFKGCKKKVHLIKIQCKFCARIFCMGHGAAIFHSEECAKMQKFKIEQKRKQSLKEIDNMQYNQRHNIKKLKPGQRKQIAKALREKIEKQQNDRIQKSVRNKQNDNKPKRNKNKKNIPRKK